MHVVLAIAPLIFAIDEVRTYMALRRDAAGYETAAIKLHFNGPSHIIRTVVCVVVAGIALAAGG